MSSSAAAAGHQQQNRHRHRHRCGACVGAAARHIRSSYVRMDDDSPSSVFTVHVWVA